ncbi:uncharacterized protein [Aristolochia californica]|uniref:uncharacterized protein n=1 Tax=Aristolochia californica TaxID=171875 RepID=UPI0035D65D99
MDYPVINCGRRSLFRFCFTLIFSLIVSFVFSFLFGFVAVVIGNLFDSGPAAFDAQCRIVSSRVDLRSTKVCALGVRNYNAKHVFYPTERRKFRCRHDYYWASVFKVEYEKTSGEGRYAVVEAPKEALPLDCRPDFGTAWLIKDKFKVNETYDCSFVDSLSTNRESARNLFLGATSGLICGILISVLFIIFIRLLQVTKLRLAAKWNSWKSHFAVCATQFRGACLLVAYFSAMGWLTVKYVLVASLLLSVASFASECLCHPYVLIIYNMGIADFERLCKSTSNLISLDVSKLS